MSRKKYSKKIKKISEKWLTEKEFFASLYPESKERKIKWKR